MLVDLGLGVVHSYQKNFPGFQLPNLIYISHNHTDHAGELPVVIAVEGKKRLLRCIAEVEQKAIHSADLLI